MLAVSSALVLTYAFLRTQTTMIQISRNGSRHELALQAAQTGAAVALQRIHLPDWPGVGQTLSGTLQSDASGTATYTVGFHQLESGSGETVPEDSALYMVIRSLGVWQSSRETADRVERTVEVVVRLLPRLEGRTLTAGDSAAADDRAANPGDYGRIQQYALFAERGKNSVVMDPADRIDGDVWLYDNLKLYDDPHWSSRVRRELLDSIGDRYTVEAGRMHPHPLSGRITYFSYPTGWARSDLQSLKVPWSDTDVRLLMPSVDQPAWRQYRLYEGGFQYQAVDVGSLLENVSLAPTPDNPLGIYYRAGSVTLNDNVTIRGTLVASGRVSIVGKSVHLGSFNWRADDGTPLVANVSGWPRLPAVVAGEVSIARSTQATIEGAVIVDGKLQGAGGDFEYVDAPEVSLQGTASGRPFGQPFSLIQLKGDPALGSLTPDGAYSIWLDDGPGGSWHAIVGVDQTSKQLTVVGEVDVSSTTYRVERTRRRYTDIRGPIAAETANINRPPAWGTPSADDWEELYDEWKDGNQQRKADGLGEIAFVDWLADPANFSGWGFPYDVYGLGLEPTFHLENTEGINHQWAPPLLRPFRGSGDEAEFSGFRWKIISWRVVE